MSRRSRYARVQHATGRPARVESGRSETGRPRPFRPALAAAQTPVTNGHVADVATPPVDHPADGAASQLAALAETRDQAARAPIATPSVPSNGLAAPTILATPGHASNGHGPVAGDAPGCTAPQLRRFIKSRTYVPMHELRRRFGINGGEDDVTLLDMDGRRIFVGLPSREGRLLGELLRGGDVGYELSLDPQSPIVVGVYPMRPVPRN